MSFFGVELNAQINRLYLDIKLILSKNKYLPNFRTIYRSFAKYDTEQTGWVSNSHFEKVYIITSRHSIKMVFSLRNLNCRSSKRHSPIKAPSTGSHLSLISVKI